MTHLNVSLNTAASTTPLIIKKITSGQNRTAWAALAPRQNVVVMTTSTRREWNVRFSTSCTHDTTVPVLCPYPATLESHFFLKKGRHETYIYIISQSNDGPATYITQESKIWEIHRFDPAPRAGDSRTSKFCNSHVTGKFIIFIQVGRVVQLLRCKYTSRLMGSKWAPTLEKITSEATLFFRVNARHRHPKHRSTVTYNSLVDTNRGSYIENRTNSIGNNLATWAFGPQCAAKNQKGQHFFVSKGEIERKPLV